MNTKIIKKLRKQYRKTFDKQTQKDLKKKSFALQESETFKALS